VAVSFIGGGKWRKPDLPQVTGKLDNFLPSYAISSCCFLRCKSSIVSAKFFTGKDPEIFPPEYGGVCGMPLVDS
jgi:hypothetical protein